jgi:hypothetical protein
MKLVGIFAAMFMITASLAWCEPIHLGSPFCFTPDPIKVPLGATVSFKIYYAGSPCGPPNTVVYAQELTSIQLADSTIAKVTPPPDPLDSTWTLTGLKLGTTTLDAKEQYLEGQVNVTVVNVVTLNGAITGGISSSKTVSGSSAINATFPLGAEFKFNLTSLDANGAPQDVKANFDLSSANVSPAPDQNGLFPNNVVIEYADSTADTSKTFQAVHKGTVTLKITPTDQQNGTVTKPDPVTVNLTINDPASLGSSHTDLDSTILNYAHKRGIPPQYIKGQIRQESTATFDPNFYRYEPLGSDLRYIQKNATALTSPYSLYRMEISQTAGRGTSLSPTADVDQRNIYRIADRSSPGGMRNLRNSDMFVTAAAIFQANAVAQNWNNAKICKCAATLQKIVANPSILNFSAQTTLAASWGLMQVIHATAIAPQQWNNGSGGQPHLLFNRDTAISLGTDYDRRTFLKVNVSINNSSPTLSDSAALRTAYSLGFDLYRGAQPGDDFYGSAVLSSSGQYLPSPNGPMFP